MPPLLTWDAADAREFLRESISQCDFISAIKVLEHIPKQEVFGIPRPHPHHPSKQVFELANFANVGVSPAGGARDESAVRQVLWKMIGRGLVEGGPGDRLRTLSPPPSRLPVRNPARANCWSDREISEWRLGLKRSGDVDETMGAENTLRDIPPESTIKSTSARCISGGFTTTLLAQFCILGLGAFTGLASARLLGPQGRGELAALILWPSVLVMVFSLGINQAIVYYTGQRRHSMSEIWTASMLIGFIQSLCVVLVGLLVVPVALHRYSPEVMHLALVFLFSTPFLMLSGYPANLLQGRLDFLSFNGIRTLAPLVYALGLAVLLLLRKANLQTVVAFQILGYVVAVAGGCWILFRKGKWGLSWQKGVLKSLLSYGWKTQLASVTYYINQRVDQLLLSLFVSPRELGLYVVAVTVSSALGFLPQASAMMTLAAGSNLPRAGAKAFISNSFRTSLTWLVVGCSALFVVAPWLITLVFGSKFSGSTLACRILLPGSIALGLNQVLYEGARSLNDPVLPSYAEGLAAFLTCLGLYVLLPRFGFLGAAIASTLAYSSSLVFMLVLYRLRLRFPLHELLGVSNAPVLGKGV